VTYAALCQEWNLDPAEEVGIEDPWLAMQLRLGLSERLHRKRKDAEEPTEEERDAIQRQEYASRLERARRELRG
jgi:hypothetical protein